MFNWIKNLIKRNTTLILKQEWEVKPSLNVQELRKVDTKQTTNLPKDITKHG